MNFGLTEPFMIMRTRPSSAAGILCTAEFGPWDRPTVSFLKFFWKIKISWNLISMKDNWHHNIQKKQWISIIPEKHWNIALEPMDRFWKFAAVRWFWLVQFKIFRKSILDRNFMILDLLERWFINIWIKKVSMAWFGLKHNDIWPWKQWKILKFVYIINSVTCKILCTIWFTIKDSNK